MAILKYKKADGSYQTLTNYTVNAPSVVETSGTSTSAVMSQNAVTNELKKYTKTDDLNTVLNLDQYITESELTNKNYVTQGSLNTEINNFFQSTEGQTIIANGVNLDGYALSSEVEAVDNRITTITSGTEVNTFKQVVENMTFLRDQIQLEMANLYTISDADEKFATQTSLSSYIPTSAITATSGTSTSDVMSQKAVTDYVEAYVASAATEKAFGDYYKKVSTSGTCANLDLTAHVNLINISKDDAIPFVNPDEMTMPDFHIIIKNTSDEEVSVKMPNVEGYDVESDNVVLCNGTSALKIAKNAIGEVNIIKADGKLYYRFG